MTKEGQSIISKRKLEKYFFFVNKNKRNDFCSINAKAAIQILKQMCKQNTEATKKNINKTL